MAPGTAGFLGERYAPMALTTSMIPENLRRLDEITELDHFQRAELRDLMSQRFARGRSSPSALGSHNVAYERVRGLMASEALFDISREPQTVRDRYGPTQFGEQALAARRLIEAGVPFVRVARAWWDSHGQNFETHQEMVPELDHVMATLLDDLAERGLLENTLVITLAEFGRTPEINPSLGRDHFATAWSATLSGCGGPGRLGLRQDRRQRPTGGRRPDRARRAVRHHLPGPGHRPPEALHGRLAPRPADRPRHRAGRASARLNCRGLSHANDVVRPLVETRTVLRPSHARIPRCPRCTPRARRRSRSSRSLPRQEIVFAAGAEAGDRRLSSSAARTSRSMTSTWTRTSPSRRSWAGHESYVTGLALAGPYPRLRGLRRPADLVGHRVRLAGPLGRRASQVDPPRGGHARRQDRGERRRRHGLPALGRRHRAG